MKIFEITKIEIRIAYREQQYGNDQTVALAKELKTSSKLLSKGNFYGSICYEGGHQLYWFLYLLYREANTGLMEEYGK